MIKKTGIITLKELQIYFLSPVAYIVLMIVISIFNIFFYVILEQNQEATLRDIFKLMEFMFIFIVPLLTMKVFAEETRTGTMEFLLTSPVSRTSIVLGKYAGSLIFFSLLMVLTFIYFWLIEYFGTPDRSAAAVGYFGVWLEGAFFVAVGLLTSSWTKNQIIAAISSYLILFLLYFSMTFLKYLPEQGQGIIRVLSVWSHAENFSSGILTTSDLIFFLSGIFICLLLTRLSIANKI